MRLTKQQVIDRLKSGEVLIDDGAMAKFKDGGQCNVFTFWRLRDDGHITSNDNSYPMKWRWVNQ